MTDATTMLETIYSEDAEQMAEILRTGGVIAYPTEGVWGIGCDPFNEEALMQVLNIKHREKKQGFILLASSWSQIIDLIDLEQLSANDKMFLNAAWPSHITFLLPKAKNLPNNITGDNDQIAIRITDFAADKELIQAFGAPIVSTSANLHGMPSARTVAEIKACFNGRIHGVFVRQAGNAANPSKIYDLRTQSYIR